MSRILITGGAGFIGLHLARHLIETGHGAVDLLDDFSRARRDRDLDDISGRVRLIERDLRHENATADLGGDYETIYHLAAIVGVATVQGRPYDVLSDNVRMTLSALELARRQRRLRRFVFASTSEAYAATQASIGVKVPTPEDVPLLVPPLGEARGTYLLSKIYGEALCAQSGVPFTVCRPHNVYGPRMGLRHVIPELLQRAHVARPGDGIEVWSVDHTRTFCYVADAVAMLALAADSQAACNATLNIGAAGPETTIKQLAELIFSAVGRPLTLVPRPATPGSPVRRCPDMARTEKMLGFRAGIGLAEGVGLTYDWYRTRVFEANSWPT